MKMRTFSLPDTRNFGFGIGLWIGCQGPGPLLFRSVLGVFWFTVLGGTFSKLKFHVIFGCDGPPLFKG